MDQESLTKECILVDDEDVEVFEVYDTEHESLNRMNDLPQKEKHTREIIENMNTVSSVPVTSEPQKVLVLTFWRSGSTWVGKLLSKIPNTFYVYEPLHIIRYYWMERRINMYHGLKVNFLEQLLTCAIPLEFVYHLSSWPGMYDNIKCNSSRCNIHRIITEECRNASFRIVKANRLQLQEVEEILLKKTLSNLKVIYLVRDPRGVINSIRHIEKKYIDITVDDVCPRMRADLAMYPILKDFYPSNFFFLRYEDLANHSLKEGQRIMVFHPG
ncbi:Carbohydrate sulfotransferase 4 [Armadillidium nasatum]|uniref:Carbohydrate sulfotransferase 4 n=1 Tax=Armadillidium nasatum TaxID=96803 RepID=A0A5N5TJ48_9CRUS|nr:Carbohydrate sulfotransferase 4 [Armadillidium nasatum]